LKTIVRLIASSDDPVVWISLLGAAAVIFIALYYGLPGATN